MLSLKAPMRYSDLKLNISVYAHECCININIKNNSYFIKADTAVLYL